MVYIRCVDLQHFAWLELGGMISEGEELARQSLCGGADITSVQPNERNPIQLQSCTLSEAPVEIGDGGARKSEIGRNVYSSQYTQLIILKSQDKIHALGRASKCGGAHSDLPAQRPRRLSVRSRARSPRAQRE